MTAQRPSTIQTLFLIGFVITLSLPIHARAADPEVIQLIDQLVNVGSEGIGFHPTAWAGGFMAIDEEPRFRGGIIGSRKPIVFPAMRALVQKGPAALPDLIAHLTDRRATKVKVLRFMGMWHSDEYDPRQRPRRTYPIGPLPRPVYDQRRQRDVRSYTLQIGDLCYVIIGQIVNRNLIAVRYQPSACLVINSPIETPLLAEAVRKDWSALAPEQHRESLLRDALEPEPFAEASAIKRLLYYYPKEGEEFALRLLERPVYNPDIVWNFIEISLIREERPGRWRTLVEEFARDLGSAYASTVPHWLRWIYWRTYSSDVLLLEKRSRAAEILARIYPADDPDRPTLSSAVSPFDATELIQALACFPSPRLDGAIHRLYRSLKPEQFQSPDKQFELEQLQEACVRRLFRAGHPGVIVPYFKLKVDAISDRASVCLPEIARSFLRCVPLWVLGIDWDVEDDGDDF